jgi:hypothetical protein
VSACATNEPRDLALRAQFNHRAVTILLKHPTAPERQVYRRRLIEDANTLSAIMRQCRIQIFDLKCQHDVAVREIAFPSKLHEFDDRTIAGIEEGAADL